MTKRFLVNQKALTAILSSMQPICNKRTNLDITTSILFCLSHRELVLKTTDLEMSLQASCPIEDNDFFSVESFLVNGKRVFDVVKELEGSISCSLENNQLCLQAGSISMALNIHDATEFPPFPEKIENMMQLETHTLRWMFDKTVFLVPQSGFQQAFLGLFLETTPDSLKMTATDGHCLAQARSSQHTASERRAWILPRKAVMELKKIVDSTKEEYVFLGTCGNQVVFSGETFNFFTRVIADTFPSYETILNKDGYISAQVDRHALVRTMRRSAALLSGQFLATTLQFRPAQIDVLFDNKETGTLHERVVITGGLDTWSVNAKFYSPYILNGLQVFQDEKISFFLNNEARPIMFESSLDHMSVCYLVMPVCPQ